MTVLAKAYGDLSDLERESSSPSPGTEVVSKFKRSKQTIKTFILRARRFIGSRSIEKVRRNWTLAPTDRDRIGILKREILEANYRKTSPYPLGSERRNVVWYTFIWNLIFFRFMMEKIKTTLEILKSLDTHKKLTRQPPLKQYNFRVK